MSFDGATAQHFQPPQDPETIQEFISRWPNSWHLQDSYFPPDPSHIIESIHSGSGTLITNGSYKPQVLKSLGAAAWRFKCGISGAICGGECQTSGQQHEVNPYHSKLQGLHAGLSGMLAFCSFHQIWEGSLLVGCDCDGAFKQASKCALNISIRTKHADIIWAIWVMVSKFKELSISVKFLLGGPPG